MKIEQIPLLGPALRFNFNLPPVYNLTITKTLKFNIYSGVFAASILCALELVNYGTGCDTDDFETCKAKCFEHVVGCVGCSIGEIAGTLIAGPVGGFVCGAISTLISRFGTRKWRYKDAQNAYDRLILDALKTIEVHVIDINLIPTYKEARCRFRTLILKYSNDNHVNDKWSSEITETNKRKCQDLLAAWPTIRKFYENIPAPNEGAFGKHITADDEQLDILLKFWFTFTTDAVNKIKSLKTTYIGPHLDYTPADNEEIIPFDYYC